MGHSPLLADRHVRRLVREHLARVTRNAQRPSTRDRFISFGPDPVRILLIGNGIALGYGVGERSDTLDGKIGTRVADATGRGVVVNNHTQDSSKLVEQAVAVVAGMSLQTEDIVVWCPSYSEVLEQRRAGYWRDTMTTFLEHVSPTVSVVLVEVPMIDSTDFDTRQINGVIKRINQALRLSARTVPNVTVCAPPHVEFAFDRDYLYDAAYYEALGENIAEIALRQRFRDGYRFGRMASTAAAVESSPAETFV